MVNKLVQPQEIQVWYLIPSIRKEIALAMKKENLPQKNIASLLGITEAAISQYSNKKRAKGIIFGKKVLDEISLAAKRIIKGDKPTFEIQRILKLEETHKILCSLHRKHGGASDDCDVCRLK
jgi:predicted transcriptional regulator